MQLTQVQVERLEAKDVEKYCKKYKTYAGAETIETFVEGFISLFTRALGAFLPIKDVGVLQSALKKDCVFTKELSTLVGSLALRCGQLLMVANSALITTKRVDFSARKFLERSCRPQLVFESLPDWKKCDQTDEPVQLSDGLKRGFVREELLVVPPTTQLPLVNALILYAHMQVCVCRPRRPSALYQRATARFCSRACEKSRDPRCGACSYHVRPAFSRKALPRSADLFFNHVLFHPTGFPDIFLACSTEYILGLSATASSIALPSHSSFILPSTFFVYSAI